MQSKVNATEAPARCIQCRVQEEEQLIEIDCRHICKKCVGSLRKIACKYKGSCLFCNATLAVGTQIHWTKGAAVCVDCFAGMEKPESALRQLICQADKTLPSPPHDNQVNAEPSERAPLTVTQLTEQISGVITPKFAKVSVFGEISGFAEKNGHWYFNLKDETALLGAVCFQKSNVGILFKPENGLKVIANGAISVYSAQGKYQIRIESLKPAGEGEFQLAFKQLKEKLENEGLFDDAVKRPLPAFPRKVALVTSDTGAAIKDMLPILENCGISIIVSPAAVQGKGADQSIVDALEALRQVADVDVIIVGRGGGAPEDLHCFNSELLARAIRNAPVPVISAVGHERDWSISDLAADCRAATPTAAAELIARLRRESGERLERLRARIAISMEKRINDVGVRMAKADVRDRLLQMDYRVELHKQRLAGMSEELFRGVQTLMVDCEEARRETVDELNCLMGKLIQNAELRLVKVDTRKNAIRILEKTAELERDVARLRSAIRENALRNYEDKLSVQQEYRDALWTSIKVVIENATSRFEAAKPYKQIPRYEERLKCLSVKQRASRDKMIRCVDTRLERSADKARALTAKLHALGPESVTARGYSILHKEDGSLITSALSLQIGEEVIAKLRLGKIRLVVKSIHE